MGDGVVHSAWGPGEGIAENARFDRAIKVELGGKKEERKEGRKEWKNEFCVAGHIITEAWFYKSMWPRQLARLIYRGKKGIYRRRDSVY